MNCGETQELVHAYVDGELDLVRSLDLERHLKDCDACSLSEARIRALRVAIRGAYQPLPAGLERRIAQDVRKATKGETRIRLSWRLVGIAATAALVLVVGSNLIRLATRSLPDDAVARDVVSSHVRSLMADHLADVASSDQHTVKPWFNGKLDYSPPVIDLANRGFALIGGRLDYIDNQSVVALVYQRRQHIINLFVWRMQDSSNSSRTSTINGYNVVNWTQSGMAFWFVSDLNKDELGEFANLVKEEYSQTMR